MLNARKRSGNQVALWQAFLSNGRRVWEGPVAARNTYSSPGEQMSVHTLFGGNYYYLNKLTTRTAGPQL
jgi:hypothetical protein